MHRLKLIQEAQEILTKAGFYTTDTYRESGIAFDLIARKDEDLIIIRAVLNADSTREENTRGLKVLSDTLDASPLYIAKYGGRRELERGVVYSRRGIPLLSIGTLEDMMLEGVPPYVFSAPGGFYVQMDSELLKQARKERKISLRKLADVAGVSRKSIQKYEKGMGADLEVAVELEEFLGEDLILPLNPLEHKEEEEEKPSASLDGFSGLEKLVFDCLQSMGYRIVPTQRCPFEAVTADDAEDRIMLSGITSEDNQNIKKKAKVVSSLSDITEKESVIFIRKRYIHTNIEGIPLIDKDELKKIDDREEIVKILMERKEAK